MKNDKKKLTSITLVEKEEERLRLEKIDLEEKFRAERLQKEEDMKVYIATAFQASHRGKTTRKLVNANKTLLRAGQIIMAKIER